MDNGSNSFSDPLRALDDNGAVSVDVVQEFDTSSTVKLTHEASMQNPDKEWTIFKRFLMQRFVVSKIVSVSSVSIFSLLIICAVCLCYSLIILSSVCVFKQWYA